MEWLENVIPANLLVIRPPCGAGPELSGIQ
jgi:hypothetical protein